MRRYNPSEIEPKWQKAWADSELYNAQEDSDKEKSYVTAMFPYPSGSGLHVGHVRNYAITDAIARFNRQKGKNVLSTIGWDAFGLPAENYAIKTGVAPRVSTHQNIDNFRTQLKRLGVSYDWSREISTDDPSYYKWTQWIFTKLFEHNLAYQAENPQWWCETDKTVLANEQVEGGRCWRCGNPVVKKSLKQWFFKITDYADPLLEGIDNLQWPESIKAMQRNWIGKSTGAEVDFALAKSTGSGDGKQETGEKIKVFTTRPDTIFGATFLVLAPEHPLVEALATQDKKAELLAYVKKTQAKTEIQRQETSSEKTGVFTGSYAINPANDEKIPIWVADYVLMGYGTGAIMAVPAHDERDYAFASQFDLPIIPVITPHFEDHDPSVGDRPTAVVVAYDENTEKYCVLNWHHETRSGLQWPGGGIDEGEDVITAALREFTEETGYTDIEVQHVVPAAISKYYGGIFKGHRRAVKYIVMAKLKSLASNGKIGHDEGEKGNYEVKWVNKVELSAMDADYAKITEFALGETQIHIGEGVMINSGKYDNLLSHDAREKIVADLSAKSVAIQKTNYKIRDWLISRQRYWGVPIPIIHCSEHGAVAVPQKDLPVELPEVENYAPKGQSVLADVEEWVNVKCPTCQKPAKRETDTMDGYACSSWYFLRYTDSKNNNQAWDPAKANYWMPIDYYCGGDHAVSHLLYSRFWMHFFADLGLIEKSRQEPVKNLVFNGYILAHDGNKMSKSKGNVVNPNDLIDQGYGADALRIYELFIAPYELDAAWDPNGIVGSYRFLNRVWNLVQEYNGRKNGDNAAAQNDVLVATHKTIKKVTEDLEKLNFNTAISALMEFVNDLYKLKLSGISGPQWDQAVEALLKLVAPFAPHISEELWSQIGRDGSIHLSDWPNWDDKYLVKSEITIVVQVNGKVRANLQMPTNADQQNIEEAALKDENVQKFLQNKKPAKIIYVPNKLINIVIK